MLESPAVMDWFDMLLRVASRGLEAAGVSVIVFGAILALLQAARQLGTPAFGGETYHQFRQNSDGQSFWALNFWSLPTSLGRWRWNRRFAMF